MAIETEFLEKRRACGEFGLAVHWHRCQKAHEEQAERRFWLHATTLPETAEGCQPRTAEQRGKPECFRISENELTTMLLPSH